MFVLVLEEIMPRCQHSRKKSALIMLVGLILQATSSYGQAASELQISASPTQSDPTILSLQTLDGLPQVEFTTTTIWTDGLVVFSGVSLKALLAGMGEGGTTVEMTALNDYSVSVPLEDLADRAPIVATRMNGKEMSVRENGPFWIIYPYDSSDTFRNEVTYSRSIWQLKSLKVVD
jgi:hypothetical protein